MMLKFKSLLVVLVINLSKFSTLHFIMPDGSSFKNLKDKLKELDLPECTFNINNDCSNNVKIDRNMSDNLVEIFNYSLSEASQNKNSMAFLYDNFGMITSNSDISNVVDNLDMNKISNLLKDYKEVECDLTEKVKQNSYNSGAGAFVSAMKMNKENSLNSNDLNNNYNSNNNNKSKDNESNQLKDKILNEIVQTTNDISWDDIVGLEQVKQSINEIVLWPLMRPDIFTGLRNPPRGLLLFGPPGTGKTMIGKCMAAQVNATFFSISASSLTSKWVGEGEKMVRVLFETAREMSPSIIFVDEIDSLLSQRSDNENEGSRRIKTEFLVQFDGVKTINSENNKEKQILIVGATNRPHEIDEAARRRLVKRIYVSLPCEKSRKEMISKLISTFTHSISDYDKLTQLTNNYSGSDIFNLCREVSLEPLREIRDIKTFDSSNVRAITENDFIKAAKQIRKSVSESELEIYERFNKEFGSG